MLGAPTLMTMTAMEESCSLFINMAQYTDMKANIVKFSILAK